MVVTASASAAVLLPLLLHIQARQAVAEAAALKVSTSPLLKLVNKGLKEEEEEVPVSAAGSKEDLGGHMGLMCGTKPLPHPL